MGVMKGGSRSYGYSSNGLLIFFTLGCGSLCDGCRYSEACSPEDGYEARHASDLGLAM